MNILYIGSSGALSLLPFKKLLSSDHKITAVGVFNPVIFKNKVIALENESLSLSANQNGIELIDLSKALDIVVKQCQKINFDIILMSCYSKRLPDQITHLCKHGAYNLHPSLLPRYRGSEPVFWQMKEAADMGVSWHQVVHDFDAGRIYRQKKIVIDEGASYSEINVQLAEVGAEVMLDLLSDCSVDKQTVSEQDAMRASYYSYPQQQDFTVDTQCSAQQAYNFICATRVFGFTYRCSIENNFYSLIDALDYDNNVSLESAEIQGNRIYIPFKEGVLTASFADKIQD